MANWEPEMSTYNFIPEDIYDTLPESAVDRLEVLLEAAKKTFDAVIAGKSKEMRDRLAIAYMRQVQVITEELGFGVVPIATSAPVVDSEWASFESALSAIRTRIRLHGRVRAEGSVQLSRVSKFRVEQEVDRLREIIKAADLTEKKKKALNDKLDELIEELRRERLSFAKLAAVVAAVAGALGGTSAALANGPKAMETVIRILHWVGEEKEAEDAEQLRIAAPPKALPAPRRNTVGSEIDDEQPIEE
jgi:hypothetical protein